MVCWGIPRRCIDVVKPSMSRQIISLYSRQLCG
nr:MAG TPA: hypothetical protein [Caudoviricetes sp.]DAW51301.1 MAG TPA: hypothetical protein [Caudoviricetes sp.]